MNRYPKHSREDVGDPLYLTPYIEAGDVETGRSLARVDSSLLEVGQGGYQREDKYRAAYNAN